MYLYKSRQSKAKKPILPALLITHTLSRMLHNKTSNKIMHLTPLNAFISYVSRIYETKKRESGRNISVA